MGKFYSENNLDAYIREELFPDYTYQGIMVEVGGGLPDSLSCSKHFRRILSVIILLVLIKMSKM